MASGQKKKTTTKKTAPQKSALPPIRREVGGGVCLLLALCVVVSYFQADAIVLNLLGNLLKGLAGYGYWLAAPALALAGVVLMAHRGRPVVLRTVCALVLPVLLGAILHLFLYRGEAVTGLAPAMKSLWASGLLLQSGGAVYTPDGSRSALGSLEGVDAFIRWTEFYTKYNAPKSDSPINRFRTGETPVLFSAYTFYNTLVVAAPEIQGMWAVSPVPGTMREDGTVDRTVSCTVTSAVLFRNAKDVDASWEFMKWWTSADGQTAYAGEIEALQGESARWATANLEAMQQIPWKTSMSVPLQAQWEWVVGIEEVPGSYYVGRTVDNAIKSVINSGKSPRDTLLDAVDAINEEMINKRNEFGLE